MGWDASLLLKFKIHVNKFSIRETVQPKEKNNDTELKLHIFYLRHIGSSFDWFNRNIHIVFGSINFDQTFGLCHIRCDVLEFCVCAKHEPGPTVLRNVNGSHPNSEIEHVLP